MADVGRKPLSYLFFAAYDSMNQPMAALVPELLRRGSCVRIVANNLRDRANLSAFDGCGVEPVEAEKFDASLLDTVDVVVMAPVCMYGLRRLADAVRMRGIPIVSFAGLFSSVVMREYPDLVLTLGEAKFDEFRESGLDYSMVAVGNPQYDALTRRRREAKNPGSIRKVLVIEQGGYPYGETGKGQLASTLARIARRNPQMQFDIKPRFYPQLRGRKTHGQSETLLDFVEMMPQNLTYLASPQPLEELILQYDAAITTWSTTYLDAALCNIPLILIEGLDSVDVFDVRTQRVADAYAHLRETGCVHGYEELRNWEGPLPFSYVDENYLAHEVYSPETPCADRVIHVIELSHEKFWGRGNRWASSFRLPYDEFVAQADTFEGEDAASSRFRVRREYLTELNRLVQQWVYESRCLARPFPMEEFSAYYRADFSATPDGALAHEAQARLDSAKGCWRGLLDSFFRSCSAQEGLRHDAILQDYYFDWLRARGREGELEAFGSEGGVPVLAKASLTYNRAVVLLERGAVEPAFERLQAFLDEVSGDGVKRFQKERRALQLMRPFLGRRFLGRFMRFAAKPSNFKKLIELLRQAIGDYPLLELVPQVRELRKAL